MLRKFLRMIAFCLLVLSMFVVIACQKMATEDWMSQGDTDFHAGKMPEAEHDYLKAIRVNPGNARAHLALGGVYQSEHNPSLSEQEFMTAIELDPRDAESHAQLARVYFNEGRQFLAEQQYRAAVALDPAHAAYRVGLGQTLSKENRSAQAEQELVTAAGLDPTNADAHFQLAEILRATPGQEVDAEYEYEQAHALDTKYSAQPASPADEESDAQPEASPAAAPTTGQTTPDQPQLKPMNRRFLLTRSSKVYEQPDPNSTIVGSVRQRRYIQVTAIQGDWLQVRLRNGEVGFVPAVAAE
jgi:tetratricopeptide (TPR) repeat protein